VQTSDKFHDNKFYQPRRSNIPSLSSCCRKQIPCIVTSSRDLNPNVNSHCHLRKPKRFHAKKKTNYFHPCKMSKQSH